MKRLSFALLALAAALAISPAALADEFTYTINGSNFSADLVLWTTPVAGGQATVQDVAGTFAIAGGTPIVFGETATEDAENASANSLKLSGDGQFLFDNLLYPTASGNGILDWGGILVDISGYELNIFSGASGSGSPQDRYFYFADNGSYHFNDAITKSGATADSGGAGPAAGTLTEITPEPGSLFLLGTGLLGLAFVLFRKAAKTSSHPVLAA